MISSPIQVLIVEGSPAEARVLANLIDADPQLKVIDCLTSGEEALIFVQKIKPDVIVMNVALPNMDGFETTRQLMQQTPIPIIIVSGTFQENDVESGFKAIDAGALEIIGRPYAPYDPQFQARAKALIKSIKNAASIKLTTRRHFLPCEKIEQKKELQTAFIQAIAIGASLGGPTALNTIFSQLPAHFPVPIFVVQHIAAGFNKGFVDWIQSNSFLKIKLAEQGESAQPGYVYIAPEYFHLEVTSHQKIYLSDDPPEEGLRPSVGHLFRSMAKTYGAHGAGILLTGMGHDGAKDLLSMKEKGALTIAQDKASSLIFGMPKEAIALGAAQSVLSLQQIIELLKSLT